MSHQTDEELDALVKRLTWAAGIDQSEYPFPMCNEAADAITDLRAQLAEVQADLTFMTEDRNKWQDSATRRWFRAEEANVRSALTTAPTPDAVKVAALVEAADELLEAYSAIFRLGNPWGDNLRAALATMKEG